MIKYLNIFSLPFLEKFIHVDISYIWIEQNLLFEISRDILTSVRNALIGARELGMVVI